MFDSLAVRSAISSCVDFETGELAELLDIFEIQRHGSRFVINMRD